MALPRDRTVKCAGCNAGRWLLLGCLAPRGGHDKLAFRINGRLDVVGVNRRVLLYASATIVVAGIVHFMTVAGVTIPAHGCLTMVHA